MIETIDKTGIRDFVLLDNPTKASLFLRSSFSLNSIKPLSHAALKHWGLITSPFCVDDPMHGSESDLAMTPAGFYFRSPPHARLMSWIRSELIRHGTAAHDGRNEPCVLLLRSQIGSGVTMAMRQFSDTRGIDRLALETRMIQWENQSTDQIGAELIHGLYGSDPMLIGYVHAFRFSQAQDLQRWFERRPAEGRSVVVVIRIEDHSGSPQAAKWVPTFALPRTEACDMVRCVRLAIRYAGATAPIFTMPAIKALVGMTDGSFRDLAAQTHAVLSWSHAHRFDVIGEQVIGQYHAYFRKPVDARLRRAA